MKTSIRSKQFRNPLCIFATLAALSGPVAKATDWLPPTPTCPTAPLSTVNTWSVLTNTGFLCFVGTDPVQPGATIINVPVIPVVVKLLNADGKVEFTLDPTGPLFVNPTDKAGFSAFDSVLASPIFQNHDYVLGGTNLGSMQWGQAVEEASFWKYPGVNFKGWSVDMLALPFPSETLEVPHGSWAAQGTPHTYAIDAHVLDSFLSTKGTAFAGQVPLFLTYNVMEYAHLKPSNCCTTGYHQPYTISGIYSSYIWSVYLDAPAVNSDVFYISHEVAEFMHDPFVNNTVKPWPQSFSFSLPWSPPYDFDKCQNNLEVGDPVEDRLATPSEVQFVITNSTMTYHLQNVVTASWQMQAKPAFSVNGWYTLKGSVDGEFAAPAPACSPL
jgi:hypothetical protein